MRHPCPSNPVWPRMQRAYLRRKHEYVLFMGNLNVWQQLKWMKHAALNKDLAPDVAMRILQRMTDPIPDRAYLAGKRGF